MEEAEGSDSKNIIKLIKDYKQEVGQYLSTLGPVCHLKSSWTGQTGHGKYRRQNNQYRTDDDGLVEENLN